MEHSVVTQLAGAALGSDSMIVMGPPTIVEVLLPVSSEARRTCVNQVSFWNIDQVAAEMAPAIAEFAILRGVGIELGIESADLLPPD